ncbi:hypothetical protein [Methylocaldum sp.]|uniref:hypothetical protein n=1 Tax=Methylocaldum sp. TaxID=1969727 RepID=UPI002D6056B4|nr:hypothetical protein [Methylocaldum sp.]HYE36630.1 hypothetical protein [Methylocaldum sp.]
MFFDAEQYVYYQIANTHINRYPFPHFYITDIFPEDFYKALLKFLPSNSQFKRLDETGTVPKGSYPERFICSLSDLNQNEEFSAEHLDFWRQLSSWINGTRFQNVLLQKFHKDIKQRFDKDIKLVIENDVRLIRDFSNYSIPPHTDTQRKLISLLFYLPHDDSLKHLGTSIYSPTDESFVCNGGTHHSFSEFKKVTTAPFTPNSLFGFLRTDNSFHGVEPITETGIQRNLLLYNIYINKIVRHAA